MSKFIALLRVSGTLLARLADYAACAWGDDAPLKRTLHGGGRSGRSGGLSLVTAGMK